LRVNAWWLIATFLGGFLLAMLAQDLVVQSQDDELHVAAPRLHFLTGASLDKLKNGATVPFDLQLSLSVDSRSNLFDRAVARYAVSYDLWEEKYGVTRISGSNTLRTGITRRTRERRSVSHLTADAAEGWCIDNLALSMSGIDPQQMLWLRLEVRAADPKESASLFGDSGVSLTRLIDLFSHPPRSGQQRWTLDAGPLRMSEIRRPGTRGS
jgi:hypothetical protein